MFLKIHLLRLGIANAYGKRLAHPAGPLHHSSPEKWEKELLGTISTGIKEMLPEKTTTTTTQWVSAKGRSSSEALGRLLNAPGIEIGHKHRSCFDLTGNKIYKIQILRITAQELFLGKKKRCG